MVLGFLAGCANRSERPEAGIFWTQSPRGGEAERGSVGHARFDGTGANGQFITGAKAPAGVAVSGRYVYWANYGSGTIARANLDGSNVKTRFITGADEPIGVAVDDRHIYWTNSALDPGSGTIGRANLDGSQVDEHFIKAGNPTGGLALDGSHIYWTHRYWNHDYTSVGDAIGRANLDGSHVERHFINAPNKLDGVAVSSRYIYWSDNGEDAIGRANIDGAAVEQRCLTPKHMPLGNMPEGIAVDGKHVYWTNYPANTIARANMDGSGMDERFINVNGVPEAVAVAANGDESSASVGVCRDRSRPPILFGTRQYLPGYYATGWGEVAPPIIDNGGAAASGRISQIHWSSWGGKVAVGRGLNPTYTPHGGYYRRPVVIELRASALRRCTPRGRRVYTRLTTREQVKPGGRMGKWFTWAPNMCISYFH